MTIASGKQEDALPEMTERKCIPSFAIKMQFLVPLLGQMTLRQRPTFVKAQQMRKTAIQKDGSFATCQRLAYHKVSFSISILYSQTQELPKYIQVFILFR